MRRSYKFLLKPTVKQQRLLTEMLGDFCDLYNSALENRKMSWKERKVSISYYEQQHQLTLIRSENSDIARWGASAEKDVLRRIDRGFGSFFSRINTGHSAGLPRFKGKGWYDSATFDSKTGSKWDTSSVNTRRQVVVKILNRQP